MRYHRGLPEPVMQVFLAARRWAQRDGSPEITLEHLLEAIENPSVPSESSHRKDLPLSERSKTALRNAIRLAGDRHKLDTRVLREALKDAT
jgi:hypothetical protein